MSVEAEEPPTDRTMGLRTAVELCAALSSGAVSSVELLKHYLARVERYNPSLNAVVTLDVDESMKQAREADKIRAAGRLTGVLHGLPVTIKDTIETAGLRTTAGSPEFRDYVPSVDAPAVARLRSAGAIVFGKTNTPLFGGDSQTFNDVFGETRNPWDRMRSPGGSSGGSAAAVSAGLTALDIGSDIGGSVRNPAHFCGVCGHKPSYGIIPTVGHVPGPPGSLTEVDLAVLGPLARCADDLELALDVLVGPRELEETGWHLSLPAARRQSPNDYRIAAWLDDPACPVSSDVRDVLERALDVMRQAGATIELTTPPGFDLTEAHRVFQQLLYSATAPGLPARVRSKLKERAEQLAADDESRTARFARFGTMSHASWLQVNEARERYRALWAGFFRRYDALLCPVVPTAAVLLDARDTNRRTILVDGEERDHWEQIVWCGVASMSFLPATVVPVGRTAAGLPVGLQIVGPYLEDRTTIDIARRVEEVVGAYEPPPGYSG